MTVPQTPASQLTSRTFVPPDSFTKVPVISRVCAAAETVNMPAKATGRMSFFEMDNVIFLFFANDLRLPTLLHGCDNSCKFLLGGFDFRRYSFSSARRNHRISFFPIII
jgi:hypothetical protein